MSLTDFLQWLSETSFSETLRGSTWIEPFTETIHVLTLTLFLGFAVLLDLRLLGIALRRRRASEVLGQLNPWLWPGLVVMITSGIFLFAADPVAFYSTMFFRTKMILLVLAGVNVFIFNSTVARNIAEWDEAEPPLGAKVAAGVSLVLWAAIVAAGRAIAYSIPPP